MSFSDDSVKISTMPACTIIPVLQYADTEKAINWLCDVFGFKERWRAGTHRAQLIYEQGVIVVTELAEGMKDQYGKQDFLKIQGHSLLVRVKNADAHFENAVARGAEILQRPTEHFFGERQYSVLDIGGYTWTFSQTIKEFAPEDWGAVSAVQ